MYRPTNSNVWYLFGLLPLFLTALAFALILARAAHQWVFYSLIAGGLTSVYFLVKKTDCMPYPRSDYKELKDVRFSVPIECSAKFATCKELLRHSLFVRIAEIVSPLYFKKNEQGLIVLNPEFMGEKNHEFLQIAVCREIERCRTRTQVRIMLRLFVPLLIMLNSILAVFLLKIQYSLLNSLLFNVALPVCLAIAFLFHLYFWNNSLSTHEARLDRYLLTLFSIDAIEAYILRLEKLQCATEKDSSKNFNMSYYAEQRIKKLRS